MELALIWYTLLNVAIFGVVVLYVRAARARRAPDERRDLEENALLTVDWELVRRERCVPSRCPRVIGQPPRPRKDVTCEVCAATFLERRLRQLLKASGSCSATAAETGGSLMRVTSPLAVSAEPTGGPGRAEPRRRRPARRPGLFSPQRAMLRFVTGIGLVAVGTAVAAFAGLIWLILPGYLMVLAGLGLIISAAASGAI